MKKLIYLLMICVVGLVASCETTTFDDLELVGDGGDDGGGNDDGGNDGGDDGGGDDGGGDSTIVMTTYVADVEPIIANNCLSCHQPGGDAGFAPFTNYTQTRAAINAIIDRVNRPNGDPLKMPPGGALSGTQIAVFEQWLEDGLIEE